MVDLNFAIPVLFIIKIAVLILLSIYLVFALIVVRQVKLMTSTLVLGFEAPIIFLSFIHLVFAVLVFLAALIIL